VAERREHLDVGSPGSPGRGDDRLETAREVARSEGDDARDFAPNTRLAQDAWILMAGQRFVNAPTRVNTHQQSDIITCTIKASLRQ